MLFIRGGIFPILRPGKDQTIVLNVLICKKSILTFTRHFKVVEILYIRLKGKLFIRPLLQKVLQI